VPASNAAPSARGHDFVMRVSSQTRPRRPLMAR
jgi:hypothetical protein